MLLAPEVRNGTDVAVLCQITAEQSGIVGIQKLVRHNEQTSCRQGTYFNGQLEEEIARS